MSFSPIRYVLVRSFEQRLGTDIEVLKRITQENYQQHITSIERIINDPDFEETENWDEIFAHFTENIRRYIPDFSGTGLYGYDFLSGLNELLEESDFLRNDQDMAAFLGITFTQGTGDEESKPVVNVLPDGALEYMGTHFLNAGFAQILVDYPYPEMHIILHYASLMYNIMNSELPKIMVDIIRVSKAMYNEFSKYVDLHKLDLVVDTVPRTLFQYHFSMAGLVSLGLKANPELADFDFDDIQTIWPQLTFKDFLNLPGRWRHIGKTKRDKPTRTKFPLDANTFFLSFQNDDNAKETIYSRTAEFLIGLDETDQVDFLNNMFEEMDVDDTLRGLYTGYGEYDILNYLTLDSNPLTRAVGLRNTMRYISTLLNGYDDVDIRRNIEKLYVSIRQLFYDNNGQEEIRDSMTNFLMELDNDALVLSNAADVFTNVDFTNIYDINTIVNTVSFDGLVNNLERILNGFNGQQMGSALESGMRDLYDQSRGIFDESNDADLLDGMNTIFQDMDVSRLFQNITTQFPNISFEGFVGFNSNAFVTNDFLSMIPNGDLSSIFSSFNFENLAGGFNNGFDTLPFTDVITGVEDITSGLDFNAVMGSFSDLMGGLDFTEGINLGNIVTGQFGDLNPNLEGMTLDLDSIFSDSNVLGATFANLGSSVGGALGQSIAGGIGDTLGSTISEAIGGDFGNIIGGNIGNLVGGSLQNILGAGGGALGGSLGGAMGTVAQCAIQGMGIGGMLGGSITKAFQSLGGSGIIGSVVGGALGGGGLAGAAGGLVNGIVGGGTLGAGLGGLTSGFINGGLEGAAGGLITGLGGADFLGGALGDTLGSGLTDILGGGGFADALGGTIGNIGGDIVSQSLGDLTGGGDFGNPIGSGFDMPTDLTGPFSGLITNIGGQGSNSLHLASGSGSFDLSSIVGNMLWNKDSSSRPNATFRLIDFQQFY